nr:unnamed protein product [Callosobruchus chinensis]CAH7744113.1 unnamed protein product [Callosobruchus chinensis]
MAQVFGTISSFRRYYERGEEKK